MLPRPVKYGSALFLGGGGLLAWSGCGIGLWNWWATLGIQFLLVWLWLFDAAVRRQTDQEREKVRELLKRSD